jgi:acyl-CoA reductase-like NAD-dependent aldehyde dehydrogenase
VATIAPAEPSLEGIVSRILPAVVSGNTVVAVASQASPLAAIELAEAFATSDMPGGAVNILTGDSTELGPVLAGHMDVNALDITGAEGDTAELERLAAGNVKRIVRGLRAGESLWEIEPLLEMKTVWHPIGT